MNTYAFVEPNGFISHTITPAGAGDFIVGQLYDGKMCVLLPPGMSPENVFYNFENAEFSNISNSRTNFDIFVDGSWKVDIQSMMDSIRREVDAMAGEARLKFMTSIPGQDAVYLDKLKQAQSCILNETISAPYIEMEAMVRGITKIETANLIVQIAELWVDEISPKIEAARIKWKLVAEGITDENANYDEIIQAARNEFDSIVNLYSNE